MRFVCDSCRAQYMISDDKVGPKGVKVRCKKCGHTITVRPAGAPAGKESAPEPASTEAPSAAVHGVGKEPEPAATMPASLGTPPEGGLFTDMEEDEIGAVFDQVLSTGSQKLPTGEPSAEAAAREASAENVRKLAEAEAEPSKDEAKPASAHEWFVAIDDKQIGPLTVEKVKDYWDRGEVGADSLCWRAGFSDWIPLSETAELASVLAPRPSKPVIVAPEPMAGTTSPVSSGPVQSAFSAGKASRGDSASASSSEAPAGWKPSAASVLASLVKEENEALSKPPPTPAPALGKEPVSQSRLLDVPVPPPEPVSSPSLPGAAAAMAAPMAAPMPYAQQPVTPYGQPVPAPYAQQPVTPYGQPVPAPYPPPGYATPYPPPAAPAGGKGKMGLLVGVAAGLLVVAGGAVVTFMGNNRTETPSSPAVAQQQAPAQQGTNMPPMPPPPAGVAQAAAPAPAAAAPVNPTTAAPVAGTAAAAPAPVEPAAGTAAAPANPAPAVAAAPTTPAPAPTTPAPAAEAPKAPEVARVERTQPKRTGSGSPAPVQPETRPAQPPKVVERQPAGEVDGDDFDELFGTKKPPKTEQAKPTQRPATYVPPEPGGSMPDTLQQSDIMAVVLANKPAIVKCVNEQKKKDPALSGKLVMRWTIQPSGKTSSVSCRTDEFRSTYMAGCISGLIKGWTFPRHKKQGDPIDFPFTF